jgi:aspartyl-tRNA(Asn)/glutamyl-tRNA(Gln) amidotransferase subunit C
MHLGVLAPLWFKNLKSIPSPAPKKRKWFIGMNKKNDFDVDHIAELARIRLGKNVREKIRSDLAEIVRYVEQLGELSLDGVEPTAHAAAVHNISREDIKKESFPRDEMLANAPEKIDGEFVCVPAVMPGEEEG